MYSSIIKWNADRLKGSSPSDVDHEMFLDLENGG